MKKMWIIRKISLKNLNEYFKNKTQHNFNINNINQQSIYIHIKCKFQNKNK